MLAIHLSPYTISATLVYIVVDMYLCVMYMYLYIIMPSDVYAHVFNDTGLLPHTKFEFILRQLSCSFAWVFELSQLSFLSSRSSV